MAEWKLVVKQKNQGRVTTPRIVTPSDTAPPLIPVGLRWTEYDQLSDDQRSHDVSLEVPATTAPSDIGLVMSTSDVIISTELNAPTSSSMLYTDAAMTSVHDVIVTTPAVTTAPAVPMSMMQTVRVDTNDSSMQTEPFSQHYLPPHVSERFDIAAAYRRIGLQVTPWRGTLKEHLPSNYPPWDAADDLTPTLRALKQFGVPVLTVQRQVPGSLTTTEGLQPLADPRMVREIRKCSVTAATRPFNVTLPLPGLLGSLNFESSRVQGCPTVQLPDQDGAFPQAKDAVLVTKQELQLMKTAAEMNSNAVSFQSQVVDKLKLTMMETDCMNDIRDHVHESLSALEKVQRAQRKVAAVQQAATTIITKRDLMLRANLNPDDHMDILSASDAHPSTLPNADDDDLLEETESTPWFKPSTVNEIRRRHYTHMFRSERGLSANALKIRRRFPPADEKLRESRIKYLNDNAQRLTLKRTGDVRKAEHPDKLRRREFSTDQLARHDASKQEQVQRYLVTPLNVTRSADRPIGVPTTTISPLRPAPRVAKSIADAAVKQTEQREPTSSTKETSTHTVSSAPTRMSTTVTASSGSVASKRRLDSSDDTPRDIVENLILNQKLEGVRQQSVQRLSQHVDKAVKAALQKQKRDFQQRLKNEQEKARLEVCQRLQTVVDRHVQSSQHTSTTTSTTTTSVPDWITALANMTTSILSTTTRTTNTDTMTSHLQVSTVLSTASLAVPKLSTATMTTSTISSTTSTTVTSPSTGSTTTDSRQTKEEAAKERMERLQQQGLLDITSNVKAVSASLQVIQPNVSTLQADGSSTTTTTTTATTTTTYVVQYVHSVTPTTSPFSQDTTTTSDSMVKKALKSRIPQPLLNVSTTVRQQLEEEVRTGLLKTTTFKQTLSMSLEKMEQQLHGGSVDSTLQSTQNETSPARPRKRVAKMSTCPQRYLAHQRRRQPSPSPPPSSQSTVSSDTHDGDSSFAADSDVTVEYDQPDLPDQLD